MKKIITIIGFIVLSLSFANSSFATISYERTEGTELVSPVNIQVLIDSYADFSCSTYTGYGYWKVGVSTSTYMDYWSSVLASTSLSLNEDIALSEGDYIRVNAYCCANPECSGVVYGNYPALEDSGGDTIFTIVSEIPTAEHIYASISHDSVSNILGYSTELLGDIASPVAMVMGIPAGLWVIWQIFGLFKRRD